MVADFPLLHYYVVHHDLPLVDIVACNMLGFVQSDVIVHYFLPQG